VPHDLSPDVERRSDPAPELVDISREIAPQLVQPLPARLDLVDLDPAITHDFMPAAIALLSTGRYLTLRLAAPEGYD
jgi:hypothetical protein